MATEKRFNLVFLSELGVDAIKDNNTDKHLPLNNERICNLLNTLNDENEQLKSDIEYFNTTYEIEERGLNIVPEMCTINSPTPSRRELLKENEELKEVLGAILREVKRDITNTNQTGEITVFINPNSYKKISEILRKYGALKSWYGYD